MHDYYQLYKITVVPHKSELIGGAACSDSEKFGLSKQKSN